VGSGGGDAARSRASIDENRERDRDRDREKTEQGNIRAAKAKREAEEAGSSSPLSRAGHERLLSGSCWLASLQMRATERVSFTSTLSA
jgi:hypothetical protein